MTGGMGQLMKALLIEDDRVFRQIMRAILADLDIEVHESATGKEAMTLVNTERFDVVFLDLHLPDIPGYEVCQHIRSVKGHELTPVILLTAEDADTTLKMGYGVGITDVVQKCGMSELHATIRQIIDRMQHAYSGRVLYVEDSPTAAHMTMHLLSGIGLDVVHYRNAADALAAFEIGGFDLVITDIVLEGQMSGIGLVREIRRKPDNDQVPILAVSAHSDAARRIEILRAGANDYVTKPIIQAEFQVRLGNLLTAKHLFDTVKAQQAKLAELAVRDPLTGMYNRRYLMELAGKYLCRAYRHKDPLSVVFVDVDHFKKINDNHGHDKGDEVLCAVATMLGDCTREGDVAARMGGEEFLLLLPACDQQNAVAKAEAIRARLEQASPGGLSVTASLGVASLPIEQPDMSFEALCALADEAMYRAKNNGRNRVEQAGDPAASTAAAG